MTATEAEFMDKWSAIEALDLASGTGEPGTGDALESGIWAVSRRATQSHQ